MSHLTPWTTFTVTGNCIENLNVYLDGAQLVAKTAGKVSISAQDSSQPVISVYSRKVGVNGFIIEGGTIGVMFEDGSGDVFNSTIKNNTTAGVSLEGTSSAWVGYQPAPVPGPGPNIITGNGQGIMVSGSSAGAILGNTINKNTGNGILVETVSMAYVAGNAINANALNAISVSGNSGVNLSDIGPPVAPGYLFGPLNTTTTTAKNTGAAIACTMGGYVSGYQGSLAGAKANSFDATCINALKTNTSPLIGAWKVISASKNITNPPTAMSFYANGAGSCAGGGGLTWTVSGAVLSITASGGKTGSGTLTWSGSSKVTWTFIGSLATGPGTIVLQLE
jgi:parallel beta-helix repeat protein